MKKSALFLGPALALTLCLYLLAYYLLPGPPPSPAEVLLLSGVALAVVWCGDWIVRHRPNKRPSAVHDEAPAKMPDDSPEKMPDGPPEKTPVKTAVLVWLCLLLAGARAGHAAAAAGPEGYGGAGGGSSGPAVTCRAFPARIVSGDTVTVQAEVSGEMKAPLVYAYSSSAGRIAGERSMAKLTTAGVAVGTLRIDCTVTDATGRRISAEASVAVTPLTLTLSPWRSGAGAAGIALPSSASGAQHQERTKTGKTLKSYEQAETEQMQVMVGQMPQGVSRSRPGSSGSAEVGWMARVSGAEELLSTQGEETGYGLYSYALLPHVPDAAEAPRYEAFLAALLQELPSAGELAKWLPLNRINLTLIPVKAVSGGGLDSKARASYILAHYDYARAAAMLASLPAQPGSGPVLVSVLRPIRYNAQPHPVLVQDLSKAQPDLMMDYVGRFKNQVAGERFWQASALADFALSLRNLLETTATGLGLSNAAVQSWVRYFN